MASCWSVRSSRPHQSLSFLSDFFFKKENKSYVVRMCLHKYWFVSMFSWCWPSLRLLHVATLSFLTRQHLLVWPIAVSFWLITQSKKIKKNKKNRGSQKLISDWTIMRIPNRTEPINFTEPLKLSPYQTLFSIFGENSLHILLWHFAQICALI